MSYRTGETVIVTQEGVNRVGVVLDKYIANKRTVYDVLLENYKAVCMIETKPYERGYINENLSKSLCKTAAITTTLPYKYMLENELLPITKS
jgi:hypothetical protein